MCVTAAQDIVIAVCVSYLNRRHYAKASFTGYSDFKDVLYRDVSDGCRHRSEPAFCDIFPSCKTTKGSIRQKPDLFL